MEHALSSTEARERIAAVARSWLGTPYHSNAAIKGVGVDCAQLLRCVYVEAGLIENFATGHYPEQWFLHRSEERFLETVLRHAREIDAGEAGIGDIVLYHIGRCYAHGGVIVSPGWPAAIVHAHRPSGFVIAAHGLSGELGRAKRAPRFFTRFGR